MRIQSISQPVSQRTGYENPFRRERREAATASFETHDARGKVQACGFGVDWKVSGIFIVLPARPDRTDGGLAFRSPQAALRVGRVRPWVVWISLFYRIH
jgi:hypothetical protein